MQITAGLYPKLLGRPSAVSLGFNIQGERGQPPPPLTGVEFHYPTDLGLATSELGLASCEIEPLQEHGPAACPPDSLMGNGSATVQVPIGGVVRTEMASIALIAGPSQNGYINVLVTASGIYPVIARIIMPSLLQPGTLHFMVPLVPSVPGAPFVSVTSVHVTVGGHLTYYDNQHGKLIPFHPANVGLPKRCPRGGFPFSAIFTFLDGTHAQAHTVVRCPQRTSAPHL